MGGSSLPWIGLPANLLTLCGSATDGGCHTWAEGRDQRAYDWGYVIRRLRGNVQPPEFVPVLTANGWRRFDNEGGVDTTYDANLSSERARELDAFIERARLIRMGEAA